MDKSNTIFIADGSSESFFPVAEILESAGYKVRAAGNGERACAAIGEAMPDLVLLTLKMPDMDGLEVCRWLKEQEETRHIPVIFITAADDYQGKVDGFKAGAVDCLSVPYSKEELLARVKAHLEVGLMTRKLAQAEWLWQATFDLSRDMIWLLDKEQMVLQANNMTEQLLGKPSAEIIGMYCWEVMHGNAGPVLDCPCRRVKTSLKRETMDLQRGDAWLTITVDPILDETGNFCGAVHNVRDITLRKQAEKSFIEQKEFTEKLIESSAAATFVLDPDHRVLFWNRACEELTGIDASSMIGTQEHWRAFYDHERPCLSDIVLDSGYAGLHGMYASYAKSTLVPDGLHGEGWYQNMNGRERYLMFDAAPVYDKSGGVLAVIETLQDITNKKRAQESLQESSERLNVILDGINGLIYVADMETHEILFVNKYGRDIWGDVAGKICWEALQAGQIGPCEFCTNDRLIATDGLPIGVYVWEFQNTVDGHWYDCRDQAIRWNDGRLVRMEIATDITDRKKSEEALRLQSVALQAAANAIAITDRNGAIEWVNPAFTVLTGYSAEEAVGKNPRDLVKSGVHDEKFYKQIWDTLLDGQVWRGEIMNRHKNGIIYPEGQTITPVKDSHGEIRHFIAIKRDLTEQRSLEAQLRQSQKMESIGTLASGIAHDFNNILTAIIGYGQIVLMKMPIDDPLRYNVKCMLEGADRAARLTQQLLLFSRNEASYKKPMDLNEVVSSVDKFLKKVIGEDIEFKTALHENPLPVLADGPQLEQVLMNLATNAKDSMPLGGVLKVVTERIVLHGDFISAHGYGKPGTYALITISDNGMGMDQSTQLRIFEPFFTTKEVGKGTGLGLAVTYGIIKQHDGYISVYSEPGTGTTFRIYLPLIKEVVVGKGEGVPEAPAYGGTETIILAEDDESVRELTRAVLTEFGYTVIEAVDGSDAVSKFAEYGESIDLLLLDLIMPNMNGKEAFDKIRQIRPDVKAIFSSGYAPDTIRQKTSLLNDFNLISKPVSPVDLLRKVRSVLDANK